MAKLLNPVLARDSSRLRDYQTIQFHAMAGIISEYCWKKWIEKTAVDKKVSLLLSTKGMERDRNQVDIIIQYDNLIKKTAEVRSSFPYASIDQAITQYFDIIGWYTNETKTKEVKKDYYLRALFPFGFKEFKGKLKGKNLRVCLCGGATKMMLECGENAKYKKFVPSDEPGGKSRIVARYRVIEPIINAYDTRKITDLVIEGK